jgi:hypothetical protein
VPEPGTSRFVAAAPPGHWQTFTIYIW